MVFFIRFGRADETFYHALVDRRYPCGTGVSDRPSLLRDAEIPLSQMRQYLPRKVVCLLYLVSHRRSQSGKMPTLQTEGIL